MGTNLSYLTKWAGLLLCSALFLGSCSDSSTNIKKKPPFKTNVYVAGRADSNAVYWKNNTRHILESGDEGAASSIYLDGEDIYVAGSNYFLKNSGYWKNGTFHQLTDDLNANSIVVSDGDVYVAGQERSSLGVPDNAMYWKNGNKHRLTEGKLKSTATSIYVTKTEVK